ncbi:putative reverse transcriptase domain-containing protein [Tanacetum coccineum]
MKDFEGMSYDEIRTIFEKERGRNIFLEEEQEVLLLKKQMVDHDDEERRTSKLFRIVSQRRCCSDVESISYKSIPLWIGRNYILSENIICVELSGQVKGKVLVLNQEGYDLMLWGDLHTLFEPDEESEIWMNQIKYNLISWSLCGFCGVHILLMQNGIAIHMLTEKKYPLSQEMISKMLSKILEIVQESTQAYELLKFINHKGKK